MLSSLSASLNEDVSLWKELFNYFVDLFFYPENIILDNLNMSLDTMVTVRNIIIGLFIGVIAAAIGMVYTKRLLGAFVRKLLLDEINSPEKAVRLAETGSVTNFSIRNALRKGNTLRCVVRCREEEEYDRKMLEAELEHEQKRRTDKSLPKFVRKPYAVDADADHFYIPEEKKYQADLRFDKKGTTWLQIIGIVIVLTIVFCALMLVIPEILQLIDSLAGMFDFTPDNIVT